MLKKTYRPALLVQESVSVLGCNKCGREVPKTEGASLRDEGQEIHPFEVHGSYSSKYPEDLTTLKFDLCADCLRALVEGFLVPPEVTNHIGIEPVLVKHSESGEVLTLLNHRAFYGEPDHEAELPPEAWEGEFPLLGSIWQHYKGEYYEVLKRAWDMRKGELLIVYRALYGTSETWARPYRMWLEEVKTEEYTGTRFTFLDAPIAR